MAAGWLEGLAAAEATQSGVWPELLWQRRHLLTVSTTEFLSNKGSSVQEQKVDRRSWAAANCKSFQQPQACRGVLEWLCYGSYD